MGSIGSWWVKGLEKNPGEEVSQGFYANYLRPNGRPLGGKLYVTSHRLVFAPHLIDSLLGESPTGISLADIAAVDPFDPAEDTVSNEAVVGGGTKERLLVTLFDGREEFFVVSDLEKAVAVASEALANI